MLAPCDKMSVNAYDWLITHTQSISINQINSAYYNLLSDIP